MLRNTDGCWLRESPPFDGDPDLLAVWTSGRMVRAIAADGSVIEGTPI